MIPIEISGLEVQLQIWLLAMIRPGAAFLAAPVFGAPNVPVQLRILITLAIAIPAASFTHLQLPDFGLISVEGILLVMTEALLGLSIGFAVQIGFAAAYVAGEAVSNAMGLGFATMADPAGGHSNSTIGQFLSLLSTFLFFAIGGHLALARILVESFSVMPPGGSMMSAKAMKSIVQFGGLVFSAGVAVAFPIGFALTLIQIIMALVARSAPTLNLFAVGMPAALMAGIILFAIGLPQMADALTVALTDSLRFASELTANR